MKKIPIHFNDSDLKEIQELISILGVTGYGDVPKAIKFSITYTRSGLKKDSEVIPTLNEGQMDMWVSSIKTLRKQADTQKKIQELQKQG